MEKILICHTVANIKPWRLPAVQCYTKMYYEEHIQPVFKKRWAEWQLEGQSEGDEATESENLNSLKLAMKNQIAAELWKNEDKDTKKIVLQTVKDHLQDQKDEKVKAEGDLVMPEDHHELVKSLFCF